VTVYVLSTLYALACLSLSVKQVGQSKMAEVRIMQFLPYGNPIPVVFAR